MFSLDLHVHDTRLCNFWPFKTSFIRDPGLIDEGESAEITALRELKEETGFKGEVVGVTPGIIAYIIYLWLQ